MQPASKLLTLILLIFMGTELTQRLLQFELSLFFSSLHHFRVFFLTTASDSRSPPPPPPPSGLDRRRCPKKEPRSRSRVKHQDQAAAALGTITTMTRLRCFSLESVE
ncbi:hypothetical protein INR49_030738 [Caranx melampygus]|nr:hypothetical protein INR49_030738 [Caranx melampygus]